MGVLVIRVLLICSVCTGVRTTATEWQLNCSNNNNNNNNNNHIPPVCEGENPGEPAMFAGLVIQATECRLWPS